MTDILNRTVQQAIVVTQDKVKSGQTPIRIALFNEDGSPFDPDPGDVSAISWTNVQNKPTVIAAGANQADARTAIDVYSVAQTDALVDPLEAALAAVPANNVTGFRAEMLESTLLVGTDEDGVPYLMGA